MKFETYIDTLGATCVRSDKLSDTFEARESLKRMAEQELGHPLSGFRYTGSVYRSENPHGLVGIIAW